MSDLRARAPSSTPHSNRSAISAPSKAAAGPAYGPDGKKEGFEIYLATPENGKAASLGNGSMLAFKAPSRAAVEAFHAAALASGGKDEGAPGVRGETEPPFYGAYVRDPEGNKFCAYYKG
ncbi:MAG: VOC family protein [Caulobacteraceae bacterium]|nr:VOC family protein [Caulobacteraceae bacterium]